MATATASASASVTDPFTSLLLQGLEGFNFCSSSDEEEDEGVVTDAAIPIKAPDVIKYSQKKPKKRHKQSNSKLQVYNQRKFKVPAKTKHGVENSINMLTISRAAFNERSSSKSVTSFNFKDSLRSNSHTGINGKLPLLNRPKSSGSGQPRWNSGTSGSALSSIISSTPPVPEKRKNVSLLIAVKPENQEAEKSKFFRSKYHYHPQFVYRYPADPDLLAKCGVPSDKYMKQAISIMERAIAKYGSYEEFEIATGGKLVNRSWVNITVQQYLKKEGLEEEISVNLSESLLSRASMTRVKGKATLNIRLANLRECWVEGMLRHELGTHYLRSSNNKYQVWSNWKKRKELSLGPVNPTEEGLASLHSVILRKDPCLWRAALLYYVTYQATRMSMIELFEDLSRFVTSPEIRWDYCMRAKRGQSDTSKPGGFCKDQVYLTGALQLLKYRNEIDFQLLIRLGKISYKDIDKLVDIADLDVTRIPYFMKNQDVYRQKLKDIAIKNGMTDDILQSIEP